ncbi:helix-turn-helix domain-containing protein [Geodermatophilus sp. SYSU D01105]
MADNALQGLVQRRLLELGGTAEDASRRAGWAIAPQTIARIAHGRHSGMVSERLAAALARALDVPENRVRRAAGLPPVEDPRADVRTGPHLRVVRDDGRLR